MSQLRNIALTVQELEEGEFYWVLMEATDYDDGGSASLSADRSGERPACDLCQCAGGGRRGDPENVWQGRAARLRRGTRLWGNHAETWSGDRRRHRQRWWSSAGSTGRRPRPSGPRGSRPWACWRPSLWALRLQVAGLEAEPAAGRAGGGDVREQHALGLPRTERRLRQAQLGRLRGAPPHPRRGPGAGPRGDAAAARRPLAGDGEQPAHASRSRRSK